MDPAIDAVLRGSLALLFGIAARHKLRDVARFRATLAAYRLVPARLTAAAATFLPAAELAATAALVVPSTAPAGALVAAALLAVYTAAIAINLARGRRDIDCGCGGQRQPLGERLVVRNAILLTAALVSLAPPRPRSLVWIDAVTVVGAIAGLAALYAATERMMALEGT